MVKVATGFGKGVRTAQHARRSVTGMVALMGVAECAMLSGIPGLDTPEGQVHAQRSGGYHGVLYSGGDGVPDPRLRIMEEWQEVLPKMARLILREKGFSH